MKKKSSDTMLPPVGIEPRIVFDLESEAAWVLFPLGVPFCHWIFSRSKASDVNIAKFCQFTKNSGMPFGLTNAPATFQRLMESCLRKLHQNWCILYLDDITDRERLIQTRLIRSST